LLLALVTADPFVRDFLDVSHGTELIRSRDFLFEKLPGGAVRVTRLDRDELALEALRRGDGLGAWLQTQVQANLAGEPSWIALHVNADPLGGVVTLSGQVAQPIDAARAAERVFAVRAVDQVTVSASLTAAGVVKYPD
jgi:hypothetical protein